MQDLDIIEISSSPEQPQAQSSRHNRARLRRYVPPESFSEVIDIADSDDDEAPVPGPSNPSGHPKPIPFSYVHEAVVLEESWSSGHNVPLPLHETKQPLFLPELDHDMSAMAVSPPSRSLMRCTPSDAPESSARSLAPPEQHQDPLDVYMGQVLEIVPDVLPEHARQLVSQYFETSKDNVVERVLHILFEDSNYPKLDRKGKGKRKREDDDEELQGPNAKTNVDYGNRERKAEGGDHYSRLALNQLQIDFDSISLSRIYAAFRENNQLYAPTYLTLLEDQIHGRFALKRKRKIPRSDGIDLGIIDDELEKEKAWIRAKQQGPVPNLDMATAEAEDEEDGIECGCCFSPSAFDKMIQCPEAHLFCTSCMTSYASNLLGAHDPNIVCIDQSGCKLPFPESELQRFLTPKLLSLYDRVKQRKEIEAAGLENLEECPFCEYKVVIENPQERLFRCENEDCGAVTCRECKKLDHLPKSCEEANQDKTLDAQHAVEEAMSQALMRQCPKCQRAFVKDAGCNKIICSNCRSLICYACRQVISGYEHFDRGINTGAVPSNSNKCPLWDSVDERHNNEVRDAAKKAVEEYKVAHPELNEKDIKVDLPPPPVAGPSLTGPRHLAGVVARQRRRGHGIAAPRRQAIPVPDMPPFMFAPLPPAYDQPVPFPGHVHPHRRHPARAVGQYHIPPPARALGQYHIPALNPFVLPDPMMVHFADLLGPRLPVPPPPPPPEQPEQPEQPPQPPAAAPPRCACPECIRTMGPL